MSNKKKNSAELASIIAIEFVVSRYNIGVPTLPLFYYVEGET